MEKHWRKIDSDQNRDLLLSVILVKSPFSSKFVLSWPKSLEPFGNSPKLFEIIYLNADSFSSAKSIE